MSVRRERVHQRLFRSSLLCFTGLGEGPPTIPRPEACVSFLMLTKDLPEHANFFVPARELQVSRDTSYTSTYDLVRLQHEVRVLSLIHI